MIWFGGGDHRFEVVTTDIGGEDHRFEVVITDIGGGDHGFEVVTTNYFRVFFEQLFRSFSWTFLSPFSTISGYFLSHVLGHFGSRFWGPG